VRGLWPTCKFCEHVVVGDWSRASPDQAGPSRRSLLAWTFLPLPHLRTTSGSIRAVPGREDCDRVSVVEFTPLAPIKRTLSIMGSPSTIPGRPSVRIANSLLFQRGKVMCCARILWPNPT
jgi:hypothetical protein